MCVCVCVCVCVCACVRAAFVVLCTFIPADFDVSKQADFDDLPQESQH